MQTVRKSLVCWPALVLVMVALLVRVPAPAAEKAAKARAEVAQERMRRDIIFLASDECEGRGPTTRGINKAADYIAREFKKAGLAPGGKDGSYFQPFTLPGSRLAGPATLTLRGPLGQQITLRQGVQFHPMGIASSGAYKDVPLVFAGYGMKAEGKDFMYDDFKDIDVSGKVLVVLRDTPCPGNRFVSIDGQRRRQHATFTQKMVNAEKRDALGILFVNDADTATDGDDLLDFNFTATARVPVKMPAFHLHRSVLEMLLAGSGAPTLSEIEKDIDRELKPHSLPLSGWTVSFDLQVKRDTIDLKNIVGMLEGKGPHANETVIVGAHYDHLGYGGPSSMSTSKKMAIHYGADDNASGTTAILELARRFGEHPERQGRRIVFITFSGEEMGLLGSIHYCKHPLFPLENTVAMVNLDMVGRARTDPKTGADKLIVYGSDTAANFSELIDRVNKAHGLELKKVGTGSGDRIFSASDHASFYDVKVPVYFFFTGDHEDYHRPSDRVERINVPGMRRVTDLTEDLVAQLAAADERPKYVKIKMSAPGPRYGSGPRLGIRPDYVDDQPGVLIGGVSDGLPAARAGLRKGDRIVEMNGKPIKNLEGYMFFLAGQKQGDTIDAGVLRDGKKIAVKIKLD
ncbi:MAG: M28 family peptidase [Planctomycetes bacterium]|nr:M28 family peptidase [Planctomycetota bacterium]